MDAVTRVQLVLITLELNFFIVRGNVQDMEQGMPGSGRWSGEVFGMDSEVTCSIPARNEIFMVHKISTAAQEYQFLRQTKIDFSFLGTDSTHYADLVNQDMIYTITINWRTYVDEKAMGIYSQ